jgi:signal transduction histidine kinase
LDRREPLVLRWSVAVDVEQHGSYITFLRRVSRIVNSELSLDEMLGQIVGLTAQITSCDACLIYLLEPETGDLILRASQLPHQRTIGNFRLKAGEGISGWVAEHRTLVALSAAAISDPRFKAVPSLIEDTYEAFLSVPLLHKGDTIGVVNVHHLDRHVHSVDETSAISCIGDLMSSAIATRILEEENARLAEHDRQLQQDRASLEEAVAKRTAELQAANEQLRAAKDKAEEMGRLKSAFLDNMSHEIRTPMNAILGMTGLVLEMELTAEQREFLQIAKDSADTLLTLVNDILDFSKLDAGNVTLSRSAFDLHKTVGEAVASLAPQAREKGLELTHFFAAEVPQMVVGDSSSLGRVLMNLLGNAIKFTSAGKVGVAVVEECGTDDAVLLHVTVTDTGIGIPAGRQESIFDPFVQADGSHTRRYGGTGLGLAICSELVGLMGGRIWVESEPGKGSAFHFTARYQRA